MPRTVAHWTALVLGALLLALSVPAVWARNQVLDTDRYVRTVAPLAEDDAVRRLITDRVTAAIAEPARTAEFAREVLPPRAAPLAAPLAAAVERFVRERVDRFVRSPEFARLWAGISRRTHDAAVNLLTGRERGRLQVVGDRLVVELGPLLGPVEAILEREGLDRRLLGDGEGNPQLMLGDASGVEAARGAVDLLATVAWVLPVVAVLLLLAAVLLARDRRRGLARAGVAVALGMAVLTALLALGRSLYLDAAVSPGLPEDAAAAVFDTLVTYLRRGLRVLFAAGLAVAAAAIAWGWWRRRGGAAAAPATP